MYRIALSFAALALAGAAQVGEAEERVHTLIAQAEAALAADDVELCSLRCGEARRLLAALQERDGDARRTLHTKIAKLLVRDTDARSRDQALRSAARQLATAAKAYLDQGWRRVARQLAAEAELIHAEEAKTIRDALAAEHRAALDPESADLVGMFADGLVVFGPESWRPDADGALLSPPFDTGSYLLLSNRRVRFSPRGGTVGVEFRPGPREVHGYLVFGYRHPEDYSAVRCTVRASGCRLAIVRVKADGDRSRETELCGTEYALDAEARNGWLPISVQTTGGKLRARLGTEAPIEADADFTDYYGFLGLMVWGTEAGNEPVAFRSLTVQEVTR